MSQISSFSSDYSLSLYQTAKLNYKQKDNDDFILSNQVMFDISFTYALEYLNSKNLHVNQTFELKGFPLIKYKSKSKEDLMLLVVPMFGGKLMQGIQCHIARTNICLEELINETLKFKERKKLKGEIMFLNYCRPTNKKDKNIITPFGFMKMDEPVIVSLETSAK